MSAVTISFAEGERHLDWMALTEAIAHGHTLPRAHVEDVFIRRGADTLLNRSAWIDGMGEAVQAATVVPGNPAEGKPMIGGAVNLFSDADGALEAILDFHLVTKWKTAGDSLLAARRLARPDSERILIVGAGTVGRNLIDAYSAAFPAARFTIWNRTRDKAEAMAAELGDVAVAGDLGAAVAEADIVASATMTTEPILRGAWLRPGQHIDMIGAYRPDMREADDEVLRRGRLFVDSRETTIPHIGELMIPIATGVIGPEAVIADFYDGAAFRRETDEEITVFKNGGGAHLDLMVSRYILDAWNGG